MKNNFYTLAFLWALLTLLCLVVIGYGIYKGVMKTSWEKPKQLRILRISFILIFLWVALISLLSIKGFFANFSILPPRPLLVILTPLPFVLWFAFSKNGTEFLRYIPSHWLVFMQSFRIIVELLLWLAFLNDELPIQVTFEGRNFDVLSGLLALPVGYLVMNKKSNFNILILVFNIIGIAFLLNILIVALLSFPTPLRFFMNEPSASIIAQFPFILLPSVLVPIAYTFHILSLRQLSISQKTAVHF
ncbi:MAG: hypothetical protein ABIR66_10050 [Saprospiraceae bacterium]